MSHANCLGCGAIISCGYGDCECYKGEIVESDIASKNGFWGMCNECYSKLPEGARSECIIRYEKDLSEVKRELSTIHSQIRELKNRQDYLNRRKLLLEEDLAKYPKVKP